MKTLKHTFWTLVVLGITIMFFACKKEPVDNHSPSNDSVNWGYVKEFYTEQPIPNAMVVVYGVNPTRWAVQDTLYTDSNGRYEFPLVKYSPELQVSAEGYLSSNMQVYAPGDFYTQNRTIHLYQPAEFILHVKNVYSKDDYTHIYLNDLYPPVYVIGKDADTMICCLVSRRYEIARLQTVVRRIQNGEYVDSIAVYSYTPTKAYGNIANIFY